MTTKVRKGVVGVALRRREVLMIERSQFVAAPGAYCFPGGGLEPGESEVEALCREWREELGVAVKPRTRLWECVTIRNVQLAWWLVDLPGDIPLTPDPQEVADAVWTELASAAQLPGLLESNVQFLTAWQRGQLPVAWPVAESGDSFVDFTSTERP